MRAFKKNRENLMMSRSELARKAGLSYFTISRIANGHSCTLQTMRKLFEALDLDISEKETIFGANDQIS
jgi:predicted transcriptional regulator